MNPYKLYLELRVTTSEKVVSAAEVTSTPPPVTRSGNGSRGAEPEVLPDSRPSVAYPTSAGKEGEAPVAADLASQPLGEWRI